MDRDALRAELDESTPWDVVVIGGGATGLGCAIEAAARGHRTLLLEQHDFAKATSSRSTKLIHGGVRYLRQGEIGLVREALHERGRLMANAPHLVRAQPFVIPSYRWWERPYYRIGLAAYDLLAGRRNLGRSCDLSRQATRKHLGNLAEMGLRGGTLYYDGQFDDARLAIAMARTVVDQGGVPLNRMAVTGLLKHEGVVCGVAAEDRETGTSYELPARAVINATGVFVDRIRHMDEPDAPPILTTSQGVHLVFDRDLLPGDAALMIPRTDDGRVLFAIPWQERVLVGTTDVPVKDASLEPVPTDSERTYLLEHIARYLESAPTEGDVRSAFAGLRPLVKRGGDASTSAISRSHEVLVSASGLVTIAGGKWTTYRAMGEEAVDAAVRAGGIAPAPSPTRELALHGATDGTHHGDTALRDRYGADAEALDALGQEDPSLTERLHPRLPYRRAEIVWAARHEMARTVEDALARRTRALFLDAEASAAVADDVAALLAEELGYDTAWKRDQAASFRNLATDYGSFPNVD